MKNRACLMMVTIVMAAAIVVFSASCGWMGGEIKDQEVTDLDHTMKAQKLVTVFEQALIDFGTLLQAYDVPKTVVQSKNIGNVTAEKNLPSDIYAMIASSINKIGPEIVFVPYDAQYVINESTTGGTITRLYPQWVLDGGITGFDKDMFEKEREVEASGGWAGAQGGGHINAGANYSRLSLDLSLMDYRTQSYFPGVQATNALMLEQNKLGWGVYGYYMGNGGSFDYDLKTKQGVHAALRTLVEYSIIEVLGKGVQVPYWRCIRGANPDTEMMKRLTTAFNEMPLEQQQLKLKKLLFLHGYNGIDRAIPTFAGGEEAALKEAMRRTGTSSLAELYLALWQSVPLETASRRVLVDRRNLAQEERLQAEAARKEADVRARQEAEQQAAKARETQQRIAGFNGHITAGDQYFRAGQYDRALEQFTAANRLFGGEEYPRKMIASINEIQTRQRQQEDLFRRQEAEADRLWTEAEASEFNYANYKKALQAYQAADQARPGTPRLQERIAAIKNKLSKYDTVNHKENGETW